MIHRRSIAALLVRQEEPAETVEYLVHFRKSFEKEITMLSLGCGRNAVDGVRSTEVERLSPPITKLFLFLIILHGLGRGLLTSSQEFIKNLCCGLHLLTKAWITSTPDRWQLR